MIQNDAQLQVVREQLARIERALESLSRDMRGKNVGQFRVMAEGYVDQISDLRRQIDEYLGVLPLLGTPDTVGEADGVVRQVDLDENTFRLSDRGPGLSDITCEYDELDEERVKSALGRRVRVRGVVRASGKTDRRTIEVDA